MGAVPCIISNAQVLRPQMHYSLQVLRVAALCYGCRAQDVQEAQARKADGNFASEGCSLESSVCGACCCCQGWFKRAAG